MPQSAVTVQYTNDDDYNLATTNYDQLQTWPASKLLDYHLNLSKLDPQEMPIIQSSDYIKFAKKCHQFTDQQLVALIFKTTIKPLAMIFMIIVFIGFLFGYFTYFNQNVFFTNQFQVTFFYILVNLTFYFASFFAFEVALNSTMLNALRAKGRLLLPTEFTQPIVKKITLTWIVLQIIIQVFIYSIITF